jgi:hypothetical protein
VHESRLHISALLKINAGFGLLNELPVKFKKPTGSLGWCMRSGLFLGTMLAASSLAAAETPLTIDQLLAQGWEIAGYASGYDNRTSLILFRHPGVNSLVQCDVTRVPRTVVNCYELR